ncbi:MAG: hypothetical protein ACPGQS_02215 [Bradymonadia bacterium]
MHICLAMIMFVGIFVGCASTDVDQACRPELQTGCPGDSFCSITKSGASLCLERALGQLAEGQDCRAFTDENEAKNTVGGICGPGLACVQDGDRARCLKLCDVDLSADIACAGQLETGPRHPFADKSTCTLRVVGRPEIGLCRLPCKFGYSGEEAGCPGELTCGVLPDDRRAQCLSSGDSGNGESCSPICPCSTGLVCVPEGGESLCREALTASGCGDTRFMGQLQGTSDQLSSDELTTPYRYCSPCSAVRLEDDTYWICAGERFCDPSKALAELNGVELSTLTGRLAGRIGDEFELTVGLIKQGDDWIWENSGQIQAVQINAESEGCPILNGDGEFAIVETCPNFSLCFGTSQLGCGLSSE